MMELFEFLGRSWLQIWEFLCRWWFHIFVISLFAGGSILREVTPLSDAAESDAAKAKTAKEDARARGCGCLLLLIWLIVLLYAGWQQQLITRGQE